MRALVLLWVSLWSSPVIAAPGPWHEGVTDEAKAAARESFALGTSMLTDAFFSRGVEHLRASLKHWDHPATHFNMAKGLMNLDQPADALVALWASMRHGGRPLALEHIEQVERLTPMLLGEVAVLEVRQARGPIEIDGRVVSSGAGTWVGFVGPGLHKVGAREVVVPRGHLVTVDGTVKEGALDRSDLSALMRATVGFVVRYPSPKERSSWETIKASSPPNEIGEALPGPAGAACDKATRGELATVCAHYRSDRKLLAKLWREAQDRAREAMARLRELSRGGLVHILE